jgi:hypothetical protein
MDKVIKILIKLSSSYVYKVYIKHKGILSLDLDPTPNISQYGYVNTPKANKI